VSKDTVQGLMQDQQYPLKKETEKAQYKETIVGEQVDQNHLPAQHTPQDQDKYREPTITSRKSKKNKIAKIIFKMTQPSNPVRTIGETILDPTSISNQHLFNLHQVISKESTKRWKKFIVEKSWVSKVEGQRKLLQECREKVIKHLGT